MGDNAFELSIPPFLGLHPVFNVDLLYPYFPPLLDTSEISEKLIPIKLNPDCMEHATIYCIMAREPTNRGLNSIRWSKQGNYSTRENGSPRVKFNKSSPIWWGNQQNGYHCFLRGGRSDLGGYRLPPTYSTGWKKLFQFGIFSMIFWFLNFQGLFETLNDVFFCIVVAQVKTNFFGLVPIHYSTPRRDLSNGLLSDPNRNRMQKLHPREVDIPTYHFKAHKNIGISSSRVMFGTYFPQLFMLKFLLASL